MQMRLLGFLATTFLAVTPVLVAAQLSDEEVAAKKEALTQGIDGRTADEREVD